MASPSRELVGASIARLRGFGALTALVDQRIWHRAPEDAAFPYVADFDTFGMRADAVCIEASEITLNVHVWARDCIDPLQDARSITYEVARALHNHPLALPSNRLVTLDHRGERVFYDRDGLTGHGVVEFRATIQSN